jgi:hypothetical protein
LALVPHIRHAVFVLVGLCSSLSLIVQFHCSGLLVSQNVPQKSDKIQIRLQKVRALLTLAADEVALCRH